MIIPTIRRASVGAIALVSLASGAFVVTPVAACSAQAKRAAADRHATGVTIRWLGHAAFEVTTAGGTRLLIDPFITGNPATPDSLKALTRYEGARRPTAILVTHSHDDHSLDAKALAEATGAPVVGAYDWVNTLGLPAKQNMGGNVGGTFRVGDVTIHLVPAVHGSVPGGRPLGYIIDLPDGRSIYHSGDTWIFSDMALIQELYHPAILLLNTGGGPYTETPAVAALAVKKFFHPTVIVPMHYGTFPGLATERDVRTAFSGDRRLVVMRPGETRTF